MEALAEDRKTEPFPRPWSVEGEQGISDADGRFICAVISEEGTGDDDIANAAHIVRCVNGHDDLVAERDELLALLRRARGWLESSERSHARRCGMDIDAFFSKSAERALSAACGEQP